MKISNRLTLFIIIAAALSCNQYSKNLEKDIRNNPPLATYKSIGDMNDSYFVVREGNVFEFYMQLFDSVKNTRYPGRYTKNGDTLYLEFHNKKGEDLLGSKALINQHKKEIVFFDHYPGVKKRLIFN